MGNYWKGISDDSLTTAEISLLARAGLPKEAYNLYNTHLNDEIDGE
jgi:hypothetical protein